MEHRAKDALRNGIEALVAYGSLPVLHFAVPTINVLNNLSDVTEVMGDYSFCRLLMRKPSSRLAVSLPPFYALAEVGQHFGIIPGGFDLKEIVGYSIGAVLAYGIDKILYKEGKTDVPQKVLDSTD